MGRIFLKKSVHSQNEEAIGIAVDQPVVMTSGSSNEGPRLVMLYGVIDEGVVGNVISDILTLAHQSSKPITLLISTYGGATDELYSLYDVMKFVPCEIQTVGLGKVMSAGTLLLAAGAKGKRLVSASTRVMLHPVQIDGVTGNIFQAQNDIDEYMNVHQHIVDMFIKETGARRSVIENIMQKGHDHYIGAHEAVKLGLADKVIGE